jgi:hypothetical protein
MTETNEELRQKLETLQPLLQRRDLIGYAAAVNAHRIGDAIGAYMRIRSDLINEHGVPRTDEDGNIVGYSVIVGTQEHAEFQRELAEVAGITQDVEIMTVPLERACGELSGDELLQTWWMFEEGKGE